MKVVFSLLLIMAVSTECCILGFVLMLRRFKRGKNTSTKFYLLEENDFTPQQFHGLHIIKIDGVMELEGTSRVMQFNSLECSRSQYF